MPAVESDSSSLFGFHVFESDPASGAQAVPRLFDTAQETQIVFEVVLEPVFFRLKADQHARRLAVARDDDRIAGLPSFPTCELCEPWLSLRFGNDRQNLDGRARNIVKHPDFGSNDVSRRADHAELLALGEARAAPIAPARQIGRGLGRLEQMRCVLFWPWLSCSPFVLPPTPRGCITPSRRGMASSIPAKAPTHAIRRSAWTHAIRRSSGTRPPATTIHPS